MNCQEALNLLYDIIDKEASEIDAKQVQEHLHKCKHCFEVYKLEAHIQEFICAKLTTENGQPAARLATLKQKIVIQLDSMDSDPKPANNKKPRPPFGNMTFLLAAAAFLVVSVGAGIILAGLYRHNDIYIPLEQAHWNSNMTVEQAKANPTLILAAMSHIREDLRYDLTTSIDGYTLVGGEMENVMDVDMAHFVYAKGAKLISVFVAPSEKFAVPDDVTKSSVTRNNQTLYDHHCRGCRLVYLRDGDVVVITATTDHQVDLINFEPGRSLAVEHTI